MSSPTPSSSSLAARPLAVHAETNPRGIPKAAFLESVQDFLGGPDEDAEGPLKSLQETLAKYRFMESNSLSRRQGLDEKVPELERTLAMVDMLQRKKDEDAPFETTFELSDTLYAKGTVAAVDDVYIWLGANTMLSYPLAAAHTLLATKLATARTSLANVKDDLGFLRDQITTTEVNVARVYNWDVKRRRERNLLQAAAEKDR